MGVVSGIAKPLSDTACRLSLSASWSVKSKEPRSSPVIVLAGHEGLSEKLSWSLLTHAGPFVSLVNLALQLLGVPVFAGCSSRASLLYNKQDRVKWQGLSAAVMGVRSKPARHEKVANHVEDHASLHKEACVVREAPSRPGLGAFSLHSLDLETCLARRELNPGEDLVSLPHHSLGLQELPARLCSGVIS